MSAEVVHPGDADGAIGIDEMAHLDVGVPDHEAAAQGGDYDVQAGEKMEMEASAGKVQSAPALPTMGKPLPGSGGGGGGLAAACWCIS